MEGGAIFSRRLKQFDAHILRQIYATDRSGVDCRICWPVIIHNRIGGQLVQWTWTNLSIILCRPLIRASHSLETYDTMYTCLLYKCVLTERFIARSLGALCSMPVGALTLLVEPQEGIRPVRTERRCSGVWVEFWAYYYSTGLYHWHLGRLLLHSGLLFSYRLVWERTRNLGFVFGSNYSSMELERCFRGGNLLRINCNCKCQLTDWRQRSLYCIDYR